MRLSKEVYEKLVGKSIDIKTNKYHNEKVEHDGIVFDSKKEMSYWIKFKLMEKAGEIKNLERQCGSDIVKDICNHREDLHYLGSDCEDLQIGKLKIRLRHGMGGSAYAKSYKLQKYLDSVPLEDRPHILQTGHIHQTFYMKQDKTHCFQTSCLQDLTSYEKSQGFGNDKSVWWLDIAMDDKGNPIKITQELETFTKKLVRKR